MSELDSNKPLPTSGLVWSGLANSGNRIRNKYLCTIYSNIKIFKYRPWYPPKKLKFGKPRLGESTLT